MEESLGYRRLADADATVIYQQIGPRTLAEIGARGYVRMPDGLMFIFGPRSRTKARKIIVKLNGKDLYELEFGYLDRASYEWVVVEQQSDIDAANLSETVRALAARGVDA